MNAAIVQACEQLVVAEAQRREPRAPQAVDDGAGGVEEAAERDQEDRDDACEVPQASGSQKTAAQPSPTYIAV